jgi:transcriptional regulator with XRE-family HTH domain
LTYNLDITAARIKASREQSGHTLEYVAEYCGVKQYQTVSKWEKGNSVPSLDNLLKLCELFNCELGYLLGEYEGKTRKTTDLHDATGLDLPAVEELQRIHDQNQWFARTALNELLQHEYCLSFETIGHYLTTPDDRRHEMPDGGKISMTALYMIDLQQQLDAIRKKYQHK